MREPLVESVRSKLQLWRDVVSADCNKWKPVSEESPRHRLSAPSRYLCAVTDKGKCRHKNEDEYFLSADGRLWIVVDGMGGQAAGEVASALTIQAIVWSMAPTSRSAPADAGIGVGDRLLRAFAIAQDRVVGRSLQDDGCRGMGSTAMAGLLEGDTLHICHVGKVRCYHWSEGQLKRITNDHSWVWEKLVMLGLLTLDQARFHPQRRQITQAIGGWNGIRPELTRVTLKAGDRVLLCSDGLWEALPDKDLGAVVGSDGTLQQLASVLVDSANAASGQDNITAVLYEHDARAGRL